MSRPRKLRKGGGGGAPTDAGYRDATDIEDAAKAMNRIGARTKRERKEAREKARQDRINSLLKLPR